MLGRWGFTLAEADSYCSYIELSWPQPDPSPHRDLIVVALQRIGITPSGSKPLCKLQLQATASELPQLLVQVFRVIYASFDELA